MNDKTKLNQASQPSQGEPQLREYQQSEASGATKKSNGRTSLTAEERHQMIREGAYFRAQERDFAPGHALDDWLAAERN